MEYEMSEEELDQEIHDDAIRVLLLQAIIAELQEKIFEFARLHDAPTKYQFGYLTGIQAAKGIVENTLELYK